jgi:hypothetical protein
MFNIAQLNMAQTPLSLGPNLWVSLLRASPYTVAQRMAPATPELFLIFGRRSFLKEPG